MKKIILLIMVVLLTACATQETCMPTDREIVDLIYKENPSPQDRSRLALAFSELRGMITTGQDAKFGSIEANSAEFTVDGPLATAKLNLNSAQEIPNSTATDIEWDELTYNYQGFVEWSSGSPTKIYLKGGHKERVALVSCWFNWPNNDAGTRYVGIREYDSDDAQVSLYYMISQAAFAGIMYQTFTYPLTIESTSSYITISVYQSSGDAMNLSDAGCAVTWFR